MEIRNPADIERVAVDEIEVGENHRSLNEGRVAELQKSISDIGLQTPITVWMEPIGDSESPDYQPHLVVGQHRLEACRRLGHRDIAAFVATMDELDRELWRIDENLIRAELTPMERDEHLARRAELFKAKGGKKIPTPGGEQEIGFAKDTADQTGLSKRTINKALARNRKIAPDVKKMVKEIRPDAGVSEIEALASLKPDDQRQAVQDVKSGSARNFTDAVEDIKFDQRIEERDRMREAFDKIVVGAEKAGDLKDDVLSDVKNYFKGRIQERIVSLGIDSKELARLGDLFNEAVGNDNRLFAADPSTIEYVNDALDLYESKKAIIAEAVDIVLNPLRKERRKEREELERRQAEVAEAEERHWRETEPFEFFAEYLVDHLGVDTLRRHLKNCGLGKLEAAVENHLAKAGAEDAA